jgi:hypothetical protein
MKRNRIRGPVISLAAVAALGAGLFSLNVSQERDAANSAAATVITATTATTAPTAAPPVPEARPVAPSPVAPPPAEFPAAAKFAGRIPIRGGVITLDLKVSGEWASAYACDGKYLEAWLSGSARHGALSLSSKDGASHLVGRLQGGSVVGTLWLGGQQREFSAATVQAQNAGAGSGDA